jgi:hypothetical protein
MDTIDRVKTCLWVPSSRWQSFGPITTAIVVGGTIGEVASDDWDAEKTARRLK